MKKKNFFLLYNKMNNTTYYQRNRDVALAKEYSKRVLQK